jgi:hypothetical protein
VPDPETTDSPRDSDAAHDRDDAVVSSSRPSLSRTDAPEERVGSPDAPTESPPRVSREVLAAYLVREETQKRLVGIIRRTLTKGTPRYVVDEILSNVHFLALKTKAGPKSEDRMPGWLTRVAVNARNLYFRQGAAAEKWINKSHEIEDLPPDPNDAADQETADSEPSWLIGPWLEKKVANNPKDREAYDIVRARARGATYDEIAAERGESASALAKKVQRLKDKYVPLRRRYNERRHALLLLLKLFGIPLAVAGIAVAIYLATRPRPPQPVPVPAPSAPALLFDDEEPGVGAPAPSR